MMPLDGRQTHGGLLLTLERFSDLIPRYITEKHVIHMGRVFHTNEGCL